MYPPIWGSTGSLNQTIDVTEALMSQHRVKLLNGKLVEFPGDAEDNPVKVSDVAWEVSGYRCVGTVALTNFRLVLVPGSHVPGITDLSLPLEMPWGVLESTKISRGASSIRMKDGFQSLDVLELYCRDFRQVSLHLLPNSDWDAKRMSLDELRKRIDDARSQALYNQRPAQNEPRGAAQAYMPGDLGKMTLASLKAIAKKLGGDRETIPDFDSTEDPKNKAIDWILAKQATRINKARKCSFISSLSAQFVEKHGATCGWSVFDWNREFKRQGLPLSERQFRCSDVNKEYTLCSSYPSIWYVPAEVSDNLLRESVKFRHKHRLPLLTWYHQGTGSVLLRASQPHQSDRIHEKSEVEYIKKVRRAIGVGGNVQDDAHLVFFDCRSGAAAFANRWVKSGGVERPDAYRWEAEDETWVEPEMLQFEIDQKDEMSKSCNLLEKLIIGNVPESAWLKELHETKWLDHCRRLVEAAHTVARLLHCSPAKRLKESSSEKAVVVVHCSDGWDRTAQVCSLAQLLLDPYYRTAEGFCVLIEKDWAHFGHPFHDRVWSEDKRKTSPIFLQWLFCVAAVQAQFPDRFGFTQNDLQLLVDLWLSGWTGSLRRNTEKESSQDDTDQVSIWAVWLHSITPAEEPMPLLRVSSVNLPYIRLLRPVTSLKRFELWPWVFRFDELVLDPLRREYVSSLKTENIWPPEKVLMVPDASVSACTFCSREFQFYRRKRHCCACGRIFCSASTCMYEGEIESLGYSGQVVRMCHGCSELSRMGSRRCWTSQAPKVKNDLASTFRSIIPEACLEWIYKRRNGRGRDKRCISCSSVSWPLENTVSMSPQDTLLSKTSCS